MYTLESTRDNAYFTNLRNSLEDLVNKSVRDEILDIDFLDQSFEVEINLYTNLFSGLILSVMKKGPFSIR